MGKLVVFFTLLSIFISNAQYNQNAPWMNALSNKQPASTSKNTAPSFTIYEISDSFKAYWKNRDPNVKGSGYKPFMRWENYWRELVGTDGRLPSPNELWESWKKKQDRVGKVINPTSNWTSIGPFSHGSFSGALPGQGRVNAVLVDPNDPNTWYVGAPAGGIWKSINAGSTWTNLFDDFPQIGVSGIAVDPNDSNIIYIATGDDDAADSYSVGVFKSLDGGLTWNETGLNPNNTTVGFLMNEIVVDPQNSDIIWVGTNRGLQKSEDGGDTWSIKRNGNITDFKLKPGDNQTIYAVDNFSFYRSENGGGSFSQITDGLPTSSGRLALGVSPDNPEVVYIVSADVGSNEFAFQGLYKSTDSGSTFTKTANTIDIFESNQAWFDLAIEVSPSNVDEVYVGCLNIWKSIDGGDGFTKLNEWFLNTQSYTHADIHTLKFFNGQLFCGSDGGVYVSDDQGDSFIDYTAGIAISQFYRLSVAADDGSKMAGGLQDNSGFIRNSGNWNVYTGGDGMDYEIDPSNNNLVYGFSQFGGNLFVSTNSGQSIGVIGPPQDNNGDDMRGNWITPLTIGNNGNVYSGFDEVYQLMGNAWEQVSDLDAGRIDDLEIDPNDPTILYAVVDETIFRSEDSGVTFTILHEFDSNISDLAVNSTDSNVLYLTTSNRVGIPLASQQNLRGVFQLTMDGADVAVEEITLNLSTDQAFLSIVHQGRHTENPIYVGTNLGVYRLDDTLTEWEDYFTGFPSTAVSDLEVSLDDELLTASTYGRGVWQSPIPIQAPDNDVRAVAITPEENSVVCGAVIPELIIENKGANVITSVDVTFNVNGGPGQDFIWTGNLDPGATETIVFPIASITAQGAVVLNASVTITDDAFAENNSITTNFLLNETGAINEVLSFESDDESLITFNEGTEGTVWERGVPTGTLLNAPSSGTQVYGTVLDGDHPNNTKGILLSKCYNLSTFSAPTLKFSMAYDLEINFDIIYVEYSIDNGTSWQVLGNMNSRPNWYNSDRTNATSGADDDCQNCPGAQWTGTNATMTEYAYDFVLNAASGEQDLTNENNILFRLVFQSDPSVVQEGAIVDDFVITGLEDDEDDDNDGILDVDDNCPFISNENQLDTDSDNNGNLCDTDDDDDGILDIDDNCPLTPNNDQADFDGDGIGDVCDEDTDNDGLPNDLDSCSQTPIGAVIDVSGCEIFSLPATNFRLLSTGESCIDSNNGSIEIVAEASLTYTALLSGNGLSLSNTFESGSLFTDLEAGNYTICITVAEEPDYENCFDLMIEEPEALSVSSKVSSLKSEVTLKLSGAEVYFITLNDQTFTTREKEVTLPLLNDLENSLSVQTDKNCQGVHQETILLSDELYMYPNPIERGDLTVILGNNSGKTALLSLFNTNGVMVFIKNFDIIDNRILFSVDGLPQGIYILNVNTKDTLVTYKIIRK